VWRGARATPRKIAVPLGLAVSEPLTLANYLPARNYDVIKAMARYALERVRGQG